MTKHHSGWFQGDKKKTFLDTWMIRTAFLGCRRDDQSREETNNNALKPKTSPRTIYRAKIRVNGYPTSYSKGGEGPTDWIHPGVQPMYSGMAARQMISRPFELQPAIQVDLGWNGPATGEPPKAPTECKLTSRIQRTLNSRQKKRKKFLPTTRAAFSFVRWRPTSTSPVHV